MSSFVNEQGVFTVRYGQASDLSPERQRELELALRQASARAQVGVIFVVGPEVKFVDPAVPAYWLGVTGDKLVRMAAMAVVTTNPGVSIATRGFSVATTLRDRPLQVKPFANEAAARQWVVEVLAAATP